MGLVTDDGRLREERPARENGKTGSTTHRRPRGSAATLTVVCLGLLLSMYNATLVNVMLPEIRSSLHASATGLQWVAALYSLCYAALLLAGGALGERLGKRTTFLGGVAMFTVGSAACAAAPTLGLLLAARVIQAVGVAALIPQTLSILVTEYKEPAQRARAVGIWAGAASLGLAAGPVVGGLIITVSNWRTGFILSVMLGAVTVALGLRALSPPATAGRPRRRDPTSWAPASRR